MGVVVVSSLLCFLNIIFWIVFAMKFKKIFSTDDIIEKTRNELNHMITDVNRNADRNITLINEKIKELKGVTAEAERRLALERAEEDKREKARILAQQTERIQAETQGPAITKKGRSVLSDLDKYTKEQAQGELFSVKNDKKAEANASRNEESAKLHKIPIIVPEVIYSDNPVKVVKDFNTQVKEKYEQGETIEDIAAELQRSTQEVKFALEFL